MEDLLRESPLIQEFLEEGRQQGREEGKLEVSREILLALVQARFPELVPLTKEVASGSQDSTVLQNLFLNISMAQTSEEAQKSLLEVKEYLYS